MAEGARLESVYTATYRGFESLTLRHNKGPRLEGFFYGGKRGLMRTLFDKIGRSDFRHPSDGPEDVRAWTA